MKKVCARKQNRDTDTITKMEKGSPLSLAFGSENRDTAESGPKSTAANEFLGFEDVMDIIVTPGMRENKSVVRARREALEKSSETFVPATRAGYANRSKAKKPLTDGH